MSAGMGAEASARWSRVTGCLLLIVTTPLVFSACPSRPQSPWCWCTIRIRTANVLLAGTDSNIFIQLHSEDGRSTAKTWISGSFDQNSLDEKTLYLENMFPMSYVTVSHDGSGAFPWWTLNYVEVICSDAPISWMSENCNCELNGNSRYLWGSLRNGCSARTATLANGQVSCPHGSIWGAHCSYTCNQPGYQMLGPDCVECRGTSWSYPEQSTTCADINECSTQSGLCNHGTCVNTQGSFYCQCDQGYSGTTSCQDINECQLNHTICNNGTCFNGNGSYTCLCQNGFIGSNCEAGSEPSAGGSENLVGPIIGAVLGVAVIIVGCVLAVCWLVSAGNAVQQDRTPETQRT